MVGAEKPAGLHVYGARKKKIPAGLQSVIAREDAQFAVEHVEISGDLCSMHSGTSFDDETAARFKRDVVVGIELSEVSQAYCSGTGERSK